MEQTNKLGVVLDFYVRANKLKNSIDRYNYSVADNIYGSIILAIAINSEYGGTCDLSGLYQMLILDEFSRLNPEYDYGDLKQGDNFYEKIEYARNHQSTQSILAYKYKKMDLLLTKLIAKKEKKISYRKLVQKGSKIISTICGIEPEHCENIFRFYYQNFKLKNKVRTGWDDKHWNIKSKRIERISEHIVSTICLAMIMNSEYDHDIDINNVIETLAIHEIGETIIGDITPFDGVTPEQKKEIEHEAMKSAVHDLKDKDNLLALLFEFDEHETKESRFAYYCDKIEADLQSKLYQDRELHHSLNNQGNNCIFKSPKVLEMIKNGARYPFDIWYEWDKSIYEGDLEFPEFIRLLRFAHDNNLLYADSFLDVDRDHVINQSTKLLKKHIKTLTK